MNSKRFRNPYLDQTIIQTETTRDIYELSSTLVWFKSTTQSRQTKSTSPNENRDRSRTKVVTSKRKKVRDGNRRRKPPPATDIELW